MSSNIKPKPLVEEIIQKEKPNESNKEIIINLKKNKNEEDETSTNSADYSGNYLNENQIQYQNMVKNKDKIELNINGKKSKLKDVYKLRKGENNIKMKIKNKIKNLQYIFMNVIN